jgi:hypothetical protein
MDPDLGSRTLRNESERIRIRIRNTGTRTGLLHKLQRFNGRFTVFKATRVIKLGE